MANYINQEALINKQQEANDKLFAENERLKKLLEEVRAADVAPVRYGEWIADDYAYNRCSACGWEWDIREYVTPYCPNCGAKMDGE